MAGRGSQTFQKRQKELARKERAAEKRERRLNKSKEGSAPDAAEPGSLDTFDAGNPELVHPPSSPE